MYTGENIDKSISNCDGNKELNAIVYTDAVFNEAIRKELKLITFETADSDDEEHEAHHPELKGSFAQDKYQPDYTVFPSPLTLREENRKYTEYRKKNNFKDQDVNSDEPRPTALLKCEVFDKDQFKHIDQYAFEAPKEQLHEGTMEAAVNYLMKPCNTNMEKARMIFAWCCFQNIPNMSAEEVTDDDQKMKTKLRKVKAKQYSYAKLFCDMCLCSGLKSVQIEGWCKHAFYDIAEKDLKSRGKHSWIAVKADDEWRLIDISFAAEKICGKTDDKWALIDQDGEGYVKRKEQAAYTITDMDETYFLTNPEQFVYDHFPCEEKWQLLARPVTLYEFKELPELQSAFFDLNLSVKEAKQGTIETHSSETQIKLGVAQDSHRRFMYNLWKSEGDKNVADLKKEDAVQQCVYLEQRAGLLLCKVYYPLPGKYKLDLFAKDTTNDPTTEGYSLCVSYLLICTTDNLNFSTLPSNSRHEWGPGQDMEALGINAISHPTGMIESQDGFVTLSFHLLKDVEVNTKLRCQENSDTDRWLIYRSKGKDLIIDIRLQSGGKYALDIFANSKGIKVLNHVCTYLICAPHGVYDGLKFPNCGGNQEIGANAANEKYNIQPISHEDPYFKSPNGQENIEFTYQGSLKFMIRLSYQKMEDMEDLEDSLYGFIEYKSSGRIVFKLRFPNVGFYFLKIFAKRSETQENSYNQVFTYCIYVENAMVDFLPFPKTFDAWSEGCEVTGLENRFLESDTSVKVKAEVPNAIAVALIKILLEEGSDFNHMKKVDNHWEGEIDTGSTGTSVRLSATFEQGSNSYTALSEYEVKSSSEISNYQGSFKENNELMRKIKANEEKKIVELYDEVMQLQKDLRKALNQQNIDRLKVLVAEVEKKHCTEKMKKEYTKAKNYINNFQKIARLHELVEKMTDAVTDEIAAANIPDKATHEVLKATFLVLGIPEEKTEDWKYCQNACSSKNLQKLLKGLNIPNLDPLLASRSLQMLKPYRADELAKISIGLACLYTWTIGISRLSLQFSKMN